MKRGLPTPSPCPRFESRPIAPGRLSVFNLSGISPERPHGDNHIDLRMAADYRCVPAVGHGIAELVTPGRIAGRGLAPESVLTPTIPLMHLSRNPDRLPRLGDDFRIHRYERTIA